MKSPLTYPVMAACIFAAACTVTSAQGAKRPAKPTGPAVNADAKLLADFRSKVDAYLKLRQSADAKAPGTVQTTADPKELIAAEKALADHVRAARANAKRGDLFTPATEAHIKRLLNPTVTGSDGQENKVAIKDDAPDPKDVRFEINGSYPRSEAVSTVPPDMLRVLPELPAEIQYRFVGRHMILYDSKANLIVDYMLNALPPLPAVEKK